MGADYYHILDLDIVAKEDGFIPYVYQPGKGWVVDRGHVLMDRLMGYDGTEPEGSPYRLGNTAMMEAVEAISEKEAMELIAGL